VARRGSIPVHVGRDQPLQRTAEFPEAWRKTSDELLVALPPPDSSSQEQDAVSYYRSRSFSGTSILALGPLTNLAAAIQQGARFHDIVIMGGAIRVRGNLADGGYFKTENRTAEWNIFSDPKAADVVLRSGAAIRLVPLDATNRVPVDLRFLEEYQRTARSPLATTVAQLLARNREQIGQGIFYAWDPLAAAALLEPALARWEDLRIRVRPDGTTEERAGGSRIRAALSADGARFRNLFLSTLQ
jgi:purine nucleosidase